MTTNKFQTIFAAYLDEQGFIYEKDQNNTVCVICQTKKIPMLPVWVSFTEDKSTALVEIMCADIIHVKREKRIAAYRVCNEMNQKYCLTSFYLDDDDEINVRFSHFITEENGGEFCGEMLHQVVNAVDETYPHFAKAILGKRV